MFGCAGPIPQSLAAGSPLDWDAAAYTEIGPHMSNWTEAAVNPLLIIAGPTGSGKSSLAIRLSLEYKGEIVNADSVQLFRGLDIGTAKTPAAERRGVAHHLLDILDPRDFPTAGDWAALAEGVIRQIWSRGKLPVVVGGTGFYIRSLLSGISASPTRDEELRKRLQALESARPGFLFRALRLFDPPSSARIHPNDASKLLRALEICLLAKSPASSLFASSPRRKLEGYRRVFLVLNPPRGELHHRIALRTRKMFEAGLIAEVRRLLSQGLPSDARALSSIGYKEALAVLAGRMTEFEAMEAVTIATRQYAKRQLTWFRKEDNCIWINNFGDSEEAEALARQHLAALL